MTPSLGVSLDRAGAAVTHRHKPVPDRTGTRVGVKPLSGRRERLQRRSIGPTRRIAESAAGEVRGAVIFVGTMTRAGRAGVPNCWRPLHEIVA